LGESQGGKRIKKRIKIKKEDKGKKDKEDKDKEDKWDRLRLLPRHIRTALPLLPSGPGGIHEFKIARRPEPGMWI
jgi:hypothetical protein